MGFYEDNLEIIEEIRNDQDMVDELYRLHREMPYDRLVGSSSRKRGRSFYTACMQTNSGIPLGIKTGENLLFELEIATFEFIYDNLPHIRTKLPRVIALLDTDKEPERIQQTHWSIAMEDFSDGLTQIISESEYISPAMGELCIPPMNMDELRRALFVLTNGKKIDFRVGDLNSLYPSLKQDVKRQISRIARKKYNNSRLDALVIKR